ncbi:exported hypothetical protein [Gammaproteobacteria bacterium]
MITVMISSMAIMLLVSALIDHYALSEAKAVDESLAKIRIYWAMMGQWNYVASRSLTTINTKSITDTGYFNKFNANISGYCRTSSACEDNSRDSNSYKLLTIMQHELKGIQCNGHTAANYEYTWVYNDISVQYCLVITNKFFSSLLDGRMNLGFELTNKGSVPVLQNLSLPLPLYTETLANKDNGTIKLKKLYRPVF